MTKTKPFRELADKIYADPVRRSRMETRRRALDLALALYDLRQRGEGDHEQSTHEGQGLSGDSCSIEHEEDFYLSTLRDYITEFGGRLEVTAVFPDSRVTLVPARPVAEPEPAEASLA